MKNLFLDVFKAILKTIRIITLIVFIPIIIFIVYIFIISNTTYYKQISTNDGSISIQFSSNRRGLIDSENNLSVSIIKDNSKIIGKYILVSHFINSFYYRIQNDSIIITYDLSLGEFKEIMKNKSNVKIVFNDKIYTNGNIVFPDE